MRFIESRCGLFGCVAGKPAACEKEAFGTGTAGLAERNEPAKHGKPMSVNGPPAGVKNFVKDLVDKVPDNSVEEAQQKTVALSLDGVSDGANKQNLAI